MHTHRAPCGAATLLATGILVACCSSSPETPSTPTSRQPVSASQESTHSTSRIAAVSKVAARVCEAIFTQANADGSNHVIGRPVVAAANYPEEVNANPAGIDITSTPRLGSLTTWYTLKRPTRKT